jgi:hypothetical protein
VWLSGGGGSVPGSRSSLLMSHGVPSVEASEYSVPLHRNLKSGTHHPRSGVF